MSKKNRLKLHYPFDISIKALYFAGKLLQEYGKLGWIPGWLIKALGIHGSALGVFKEQHCAVYFAGRDKDDEAHSVNFILDSLPCFTQASFEKDNLPCSEYDCPVRITIFDRHDQLEKRVICLPMSGRKGFLMTCGEGTQLDSIHITEILKAINHVIVCSLDTIESNEKKTSYFLPSEDIAQMWSEMLAGLSHDLRTPLACIKGYVTTLLRDDVTWDPVTQKEFLDIIVEETDHIESLINNLLDSSTFSWKGEIELKKEPVLLPQIVNKVLRDPSFRSKNHQFNVFFPEDFPHVEADPVRIEQVLRNLVDNSVKYSMGETTITIKGELGAGEIVISVTDQGIGIDEDHLNRLFEKFFRVNTSIQEHQKGMGLGLPLTRQILISHGGKIWAKSKLGQGTTLYFTLPCGSPEILNELPSMPVDEGV